MSRVGVAGSNTRSSENCFELRKMSKTDNARPILFLFACASLPFEPDWNKADLTEYNKFGFLFA